MRDYLVEYEGNRSAAILAMAADLMCGNPHELRVGYSMENALLAATEYLAPGLDGITEMMAISNATMTARAISLGFLPEGI